MEDLCTTCLCRGRKLFTLEATGFYELFLQIVNDISLSFTKNGCILICWECNAKLRNWNKFRNQAQQSYRTLLEHVQKTASDFPSCTTLSIHHMGCLNYPEVSIKVENILTEDEIKSELDELEHCEPETFANEITVERPKRKKGKDKNVKKPKKKFKVEKSSSKKILLKNEIRDKSPSPISNDNCDNSFDEYDEKIIKDDEEKHLETFVDRNDEKNTTGEKTLPDILPHSTLPAHHIDEIVRTKEDHKPDIVYNDNNAGDEEKSKEKIKITPKLKKKLKAEKSKTTRKKKLKDEDSHSALVDDAVDDCDNGLDDEIDDIDQIKDDVNNDLDKHIEEEDIKASDKITNSKKETDKLIFANKKMLGDKPQCVECGKVFSSKKTFRYHWNVLHKGQNRYPCPICGKVYQWKSNLGRHLRSHKARDSGELYCSLCDKRFASVATFKQHLKVSRSHVSENEFSFMCNECGKKFVSKTRLRDHIDWEHLKKIKFRCQLCHKPFKCHTSLYVHMQNVHANKEKDLCHVCGKAYQNAAKLKYHIVAMHTDETPYECVHCRVSFGWYSSLYRHVREVHHKMKLQPKKSSKKSKKLDLLPLTGHQPSMHLQ